METCKTLTRWPPPRFFNAGNAIPVS